MTTSPAPIQILVRDPALQRERPMVFFRVVLLIPHFVWLYLWSIGAVVLLPVLWVAGLILGRVPQWLHDFYGAYVRYWVHVYGYGAFASERYPQFSGAPGYDVDLEIAPPARQSRWGILSRALLALPPLILGSSLFAVGASVFGSSGDGSSSSSTVPLPGGGLLALIWFMGWFACMARGRMPGGMRDLAVYCLGYVAQVWGYLFLLTPRYPNASPALSRPLQAPEHPVRASIDDDLRRSRLTVFFRGLLCVPHLVWLSLWGIVAYLAAIASWFATLAVGRSPRPLHRFIAAYVRYGAHVQAFLTLTTNPFPGFTGAPGGYPFELEIAPPERQNRWVTGFRLILVIPAYAIATSVLGLVVIAAVGSWCFSLIMGRAPRGLRDLSGFAIRYGSQSNAYLLLLTDRYPYSGPTLDVGVDARSWLPPRPPPASWFEAPEAVLG